MVYGEFQIVPTKHIVCKWLIEHIYGFQNFFGMKLNETARLNQRALCQLSEMYVYREGLVIVVSIEHHICVQELVAF